MIVAFPWPLEVQCLFSYSKTNSIWHHTLCNLCIHLVQHNTPQQTRKLNKFECSNTYTTPSSLAKFRFQEHSAAIVLVQTHIQFTNLTFHEMMHPYKFWKKAFSIYNLCLSGGSGVQFLFGTTMGYSSAGFWKKHYAYVMGFEILV